MKFEVEEKADKQNSKAAYLWTFLICLFVGAFGAFIVSRETSGYVASMTFSYLVLFCGFPIVLILLALAIIAAIQNQAKHSALLLISCVLLPVTFFGSLKLMEATGIARYKTSGLDEMRPFGSELNERIVIAFKETVSEEEIHKFDETILRKTVPQPNGILLAFTDGVCHIAYPDTEFKYKIADVGFCNEATDEQKKKVRDEVNSSAIVYKVFKNLRMEEIKNLPLEKNENRNVNENKKVKIVVAQ